MNYLKLEGKHILVTGASSGIGAQTAIKLSNYGAKVIVTGRDADRLAKTLENLIGKGHQSIIADLTDAKALKSLINTIESLDGMVYCAGKIKPFPLKFLTEKYIEDIFSINYNAAVQLVAQLLKSKKINKESSMVFISSISSTYAHKGGTVYSSSKAALDSLSKNIAIELAPQKIRSNVINAGMVKTPLFDDAVNAVTEDLMQEHERQYPLGFGYPEDIANAALFLLSNASRWITGTSIIMDGGLTSGH